jgi:aminopeptidase N
MSKLFKAEEFSLNQWRQWWLEKASLNILEVNWDSNDKSQNAKMTIRQSAHTKDHPTLRPHKIKIGLYKPDCSVDPITVMVNPVE